MNVIMTEGYVVSEEIKVLKTTDAIPLCRFTFSTSTHKLNCLITGKQAYAFLYEVEKDTRLSLTGRINSRNQFVVLNYDVLAKPSYFGQIFNYKGHRLPFAKSRQ
ncbi:ssDNA-binding protein [Marinilactibacillus sp. XAAS-LB27]|uniref:ssDNA-binding protein n=1 Tax=Marinilactibacillus sp. XAAS-LB27 TaxID=3114538 RepID=UPI002E19B56F|nr:ssDNA-binding protein [Marinilactibacillus sp. XAAS-LB27]